MLKVSELKFPLFKVLEGLTFKFLLKQFLHEKPRKGGLWFVPWHGILYKWDRNRTLVLKLSAGLAGTDLGSSGPGAKQAHHSYD